MTADTRLEEQGTGLIATLAAMLATFAAALAQAVGVDFEVAAWQQRGIGLT